MNIIPNPPGDAQRHRDQAAEQDRDWREQGWRESGGSRAGWGLDDEQPSEGDPGQGNSGPGGPLSRRIQPQHWVSNPIPDGDTVPGPRLPRRRGPWWAYVGLGVMVAAALLVVVAVVLNACNV